MISLQAFSFIFVSKNIYVRDLYQLNMATLWLIFAFFSNPTDLEKQLLAQQTSLSRNLVDPFLLYHCCLLDFYLPTLNRNRRPYVIILMGLALSNTKILHYQQIEEHFCTLTHRIYEACWKYKKCSFGSMYICIAFFPYSYDFDIVFFSY